MIAPEMIRTAIAAAGFVLTVGGSVMGGVFYVTNSITELKQDVAELKTSFEDFRCEMKPTRSCGLYSSALHFDARDYTNVAKAFQDPFATR